MEQSCLWGIIGGVVLITIVYLMTFYSYAV